MAQAWFDNPNELFKKDKIQEFWPNNTQSDNERINATTRFVLYLGCIIYLIKRDVRIFVLVGMVLTVLYGFHKNEMIVQPIPHPTVASDEVYDAPGCQLPSEDNPMANVLLTDYNKDPNRPPACYYPTVQRKVKKLVEDTIPYDCGRSRCPMPNVQRNAAARQFISMPNTTIPGDQTAFAEWCYGKKNRPMCRSDQGSCNPDARGVQLEAFAGLDSSGQMRTGMRGGTPFS